MPVSSIDAADFDGTRRNVATLPPLARAAAGSSLPTALSTEDLALLTAVATALGAPADAAWASGSGAAIALLKAVATQVLSTAAQPILPTLTAAANGLTSTRVDAGASTNATSLKASAGNIGEIDLFNNAAYDVFLKLYNKASAPTVGTDTPVMTIPIKAGEGFSRSYTRGKSFATGIAFAITKLLADSDTTVLVAHDVTGAIGWI